MGGGVSALQEGLSIADADSEAELVAPFDPIHAFVKLIVVVLIPQIANALAPARES